MAIETDLSVAPYFDDSAHNANSNYYKVLFKPSLPVQVRELNELQSILQNQIEEFGDNILKKGTIIRGCTFSFYNKYPYVKIQDNQVDGVPVNTSTLKGKYVKSNTTGQTAFVLDYVDGFEQTDPDTKTLYVKYIDSGTNGNSVMFTGPDTLTVFDTAYAIPYVSVDDGGTSYSNSDSVIFLSAIAVSDVTGTINAGDVLQQATTGANVQVISVDTTTYTNKTILTIKPKDTDIANTSANADTWTVTTGTDNPLVKIGNSSVTATPIEIIGAGAVGTVTTDSGKKIIDVAVLDGGAGYYVPPFAAVKPSAGGTGAVLTAQNYYSQISLYSVNPTGYGYAFGVSDGVIYQKGYFVKVDSQTVVVSKYDQYPNNVSVAFRTDEDLIDSFQDPNLLDNSYISKNYTAPGADRLKLTPSLIAVDTDSARANAAFFPIVEFSEGVPYKQNRRTAYNSINDELATRTKEQTGDYVIDPFKVALKSVANSSLTANSFSIVVDPGRAYIDGYRVETLGNYEISDLKGIDTEVTNGASIGLNFGNYVPVNHFFGTFDFSTGGTVKLYDKPRQFTDNVAAISAGSIAANASANLIGTANLRGIQYVDTNPFGTPTGTPPSVYNLYLFNIQMNSGRSFKDVKSILYANTSANLGIADVILNASNNAVLQGTAAANGATLDKLLFYSGFDSPLSINSISYQYRNFANSTIANTGNFSLTITDTGLTYPYTGDLTSSQRSEVIIYPTTTAYATAAVTGTATMTSGNATVVGSSSAFLTDLQAGDYVRLVGGPGEDELHRVANIVNSTVFVCEANVGFSQSGGTVTRAFPAGIPLPLLTRGNITVNVSSDSKTMNVALNTRLAGASAIPVNIIHNMKVTNAAVDQRTPQRNRYVKICLANNLTGFSLSGSSNTYTAAASSNSSVTLSGAGDFTTTISSGDYVSIKSGNTIFTKTVSAVNSSVITLSSALNFTATVTVSKALNVNGPWCLGVPDIFRLRAVYQGSSSSVDVTDYDVTREFYIDHNQNPSYQGLGYLVKKKGSKLVLSPTDYLLVCFDSLASSTPGAPVTINSYVASDAASRFTTDSLALDSLTETPLSMNTIEIPEVHSASGYDFDLINCLDFRPRVTATATLATTPSGADINPAATVAFSAANKKFPVPDSNFSFNVESFLGRVDSVYVDSAGKIGISKGHPTSQFKLFSSKSTDELVTPVKNKRVMVLNNVRIPPYPGIEENLNQKQVALNNKRIINDKLLNRRNDSKKITRLFTEKNIEVNQPQGYSMEHIGNLERRIRDLEYYVALNNLELQIKDLNLPSTVTANMNRFKYGFFTDSYDDESYSARDDQEYRARVENNRIVPQYEVIKIVHPAPPCTYTDFPIINQTKATVPPANTANTGGGGGPPPPPPVCVNTAVFERKEGSESASNKVDTVYITMASALGNNSGQVTVYAYFYTGADVLKIYQSNTANVFSNTPILTTNNSVSFTNNDINYVKTLPWFSSISANNLKQHILVSSPAYGLRFAGKIQFNHNPAAGRFYKFETKNHSIVWRYRVEYPINVDCAANTAPTVNTVPTSYVGQIALDRRPDVWSQKEVLGTSAKRATYQFEYHVFYLKASGLKPNTLHKVYVNKKDVTNLCDTTPATSFPPPTSAMVNNWNNYMGAKPGQIVQVMTDARGQVEFMLYLLEEEEVDGKDVGRTVEVVNPLLEIQSADKTSYAYKKLAKSLTLFVAS